MSKYAWIITEDKIFGEDVGIKGPRLIDTKLEKLLKAREGTEFKMFDDDGGLYYAGKIVGDFGGFEPLDDFGMPNAGCTSIAYRDKNTGCFEII